jgi:MFS family permease
MTSLGTGKSGTGKAGASDSEARLAEGEVRRLESAEQRRERGRPGFVERLGMHPELAIGYLGLLLFMVGDGVEAGFLSPLLRDLHFSASAVALVFTAYGVSAALASWLSGALSDIFGPRKVMWAGLAIWVVFEMPFLLGGIAHANYAVILGSYCLRGFGYPLFAYGFLVWITAVTPQRYLGTAVGWFWSARTGGLPTLGALLASFAVPRMGEYKTLWVSVGLVVVGGLVTMLGIREATGRRPLAGKDKSGSDKNPLALLVESLTIVWKKPKVGLGGSLAFWYFCRYFSPAWWDSRWSSGCRS